MSIARELVVSTHVLAGSELKVFSYLPAGGESSGVVFAVHGFRGDHHGLERIIEQLPGYTIVVPDLPGFGASSSMTQLEHDVDGYAGVLMMLLDELSLGASTHLLGHSFGSIVAAKLAALRPFASLSLLNPISEPALESSQALLAKLTSCYYWLCAKLPAPVGEPALRSRLFTDAMSMVMTKSKDPDMRRYVRDQHRAYFGGFHSRTTLVQAYDASISHTVGEFSSQIAIPTLLIGGVDDELGSPQTQEALRSSFPQARLVMLENVGHLIHYEKAEQVAAQLGAFLEEQH
ncbi:lipase [Glutamicibacter uratoxydans]|uniref:Lipase n=1 Tax=Glutamicibacter uratoxydans TaxID=43667 RepID=A0A4Y4DQ44_GLUUR|nr:alpha/beta hydrolase [Glutamicibacter uratoxydans]GED04681.1 lipase [Glutamicibacter uratoxydans]